MSEVLLLTGGRGHPADASVHSLRELFCGLGLGLDVAEDVDRGLARLDPARHTLLAVNALRCTMTDPRFDDVRADEAYVIPPGGRATIAEWHASAGPILALHTGIICFDDWPAWTAMLGGSWDWARSSHPPLERFGVRVGDEHFDVYDECYQDLAVDADVEVAARSDDGYPLAWTHHDGVGATAVDLLGHDARSLDQPGHRRLLASLVAHLLETRS